MIHAFNTTTSFRVCVRKRGERSSRVVETGGDSTKIKRALSTEKPNRPVIIKKVPLDVNDEVIESCLDTQFTDAKEMRYIKRDSTKLGTVKFVQTSGIDLGKALHQGFFIDSIYYKTILFVQNGKQIVRCFKCQRFGHISANCQSAEKCGL